MKKLLLGIATTALMASGAMAADMTTAPATYDSTSFDWTGFYTGVFGTVDFEGGSVYYGVGVNAGFNVQNGNWVYGAEAGIVLWDDGTIWPDFTARAGYLVIPELLIFASAGGGLSLNGPLSYFKAGGGVELALTDNLSIVGSYDHWWYTSSGTANVFKGGVNFHFN